MTELSPSGPPGAVPTLSVWAPVRQAGPADRDGAGLSLHIIIMIMMRMGEIVIPGNSPRAHAVGSISCHAYRTHLRSILVRYALSLRGRGPRRARRIDIWISTQLANSGRYHHKQPAPRALGDFFVPGLGQDLRLYRTGPGSQAAWKRPAAAVM